MHYKLPNKQTQRLHTSVKMYGSDKWILEGKKTTWCTASQAKPSTPHRNPDKECYNKHAINWTVNCMAAKRKSKYGWVNRLFTHKKQKEMQQFLERSIVYKREEEWVTQLARCYGQQARHVNSGYSRHKSEFESTKAEARIKQAGGVQQGTVQCCHPLLGPRQATSSRQQVMVHEWKENLAIMQWTQGEKFHIYLGKHW